MDIRDNFDYLEATKRLIDFYYDQCPGSIMPLFLLYLARTGKPASIDEKIRKTLDWKDVPEQRYSSPILSQFTQDDAAELAKTDPAGARLLSRWRCNEMDHMSIIVLYEDEEPRIQEIREEFQKYDEALGDSMQKRRALFLFVQGLRQCPAAFVKERYLDIADMILKSANVFDTFEDIHLSRFERWILGDIKGTVFVPFARAPFAAALLSNASVSAESSGGTGKLAAMVSHLLLAGNGIKKVNCAPAAKPYGMLSDIKYDGVILNYAHHSERTDETSWHYCLKQMKNNLSDKARYVGLIETKYLFRMVGKQQLFKEIIADCSLEAIVLLPRRYGSALIYVNKAKKHPNHVKMVNLYNESLDYDREVYQHLVSHNAKNVSIETLSKERTRIESFFEEAVPQMDGFKVVPLGKYLKRIRKESLFGVSDSTYPEDLSVVQIDRDKPYSPYEFTASSCPVDSFSIYEPTYYLDTDSLLVNEYGNLDARLYHGDGEAVFSDGLAFSVSSRMWPPYLINELRKPYVLAQLNHWSSSKDKHHSEDEILDLKIYVPDVEDPYEAERDICRKELDENILPNDFVVKDDEGNFFTIGKCLGKGGFGISYLAARDSYWSTAAEPETVVLKEFFPSGTKDGGERFKGKRVAMAIGDIAHIREETDLHSFLVKFIDEAETMALFSKFPGCRVRRAGKVFKCSETNTYYYVMDYYDRGTLEDELSANGPMSEKELIERVMKPTAVALDTMHNNHWLHLDIKAENILIDDEGLAILGDLGISQHYDELGNKTTKGGGVGTRGSCSRLQYDMEYTRQFHPELDIFSFAALMYYALTGNDIRHFSPDDLDAPFIEISEKSRKALRKALDQNLETTPKSVRDFMHMLPGCEKMVFEDIQPVETDPDPAQDEFMPEEFEDLPYFT